MKIHLIGIGGAGMHSLALYLYEAGHEISGSDCMAGDELCQFWKDRNVAVYKNHAPEHIGNAECVIYSAAVPIDNVERQAARRRNIGISRGEALARFANRHAGSIAVCGTHGKGTTAAGISFALCALGCHVSDILGATPLKRHQPCRFDPDAQYLVCEVDESDKTHRFHRPKLLLINNVEADHLNVYKDLEDIVGSFESHVRSCLDAGAMVVIHYSGAGAPSLYQRLADCRQIRWIAPEGALDSPDFAYEITPPNDMGICRLTFRGASGVAVQITPALGGRANAQNLASVVAVLNTLGWPLEEIAPVLESYEGLCDRCEIQTIRRRKFVTDYASHPTCIKNDIEWIRARCARVVAVYHPFRYSLMQCHWNEIAQALSGADEIDILPFDGGGETPVGDISSESLAQKIRGLGKISLSFTNARDCIHHAVKQIRPNDSDTLIVFSGGAVFKMVKETLQNAEETA